MKQKRLYISAGLIILTVGVGGIWHLGYRFGLKPARRQVLPLGQFSPREYTPEEVHQILTRVKGTQNASSQGFIILDVRSQAEYNAGHLPGAVHVDYYSNAEELAVKVGTNIPITYCTHSTWRAPYAAYQLYKLGYRQVGILQGGYYGWLKFKNGLSTKNKVS